MGLVLLVLGLILFLGSHLFVTMRPQRAAVVKRLGEWPYKGLFSVVSIAGLVLMGRGFGLYALSGPPVLWTAPAWTRHVTEALMLPASILVVAPYLPGGIKRAVGHPMLIGVEIWAAAHLLVNGDLAGVILFGSVLAWAVYAHLAARRRSEPSGPPIPQGGLRNDIAAVVVGVALYLALGLLFHPLVIGRPVFGGG